MEANNQRDPSLSQGRPTCESCRQRKVRCNRGTPCSQCSRLQLSCVYQTRKRRAPLSQGPSQTVLQEAVSQARQTSPVQGASSTQDVLDRLSSIEALLSDIRGPLLDGQSTNSAAKQSHPTLTPVLVPPNQPSEMPADHQVRGNYVNNSVFVGLLFDGTSQQASQHTQLPRSVPNPRTMRPPFNHGIAVTDVFGPPVDSLDLPSETYSKLWAIYAQNFDPLAKMLHIPTIQPVLLNASIHPDKADDMAMALLFAVCFAALCTVPKADVVQQFTHTKSTLLRHFMQEMDASFMRAQLILCPNTLTLTALVIYLIALRTHDATRTVWILTGLAKRIAESLGIHEDGSRLRLSPFDTEMRRRLWWHLTALEASAPENHGFNSSLTDRDRDFPLPNNVNDEDISPRMTEHATRDEMWAETTFSILNLDLFRRLRSAIATNSNKDLHVQIRMVKETEYTMSQLYLRFADMNSPVCRAAENLLRISVLKAQFILTLQNWLSTGVKQGCPYNYLPQSIFTTAIELLDYAYRLQSGHISPNFVWFFQQTPQLYALLLVLRTLHVSPGRAEADRAWLVVENYFTCLADFEEAAELKGRTSCVWTILNTLRNKVRKSHSSCTKQDPPPAESSCSDAEPESAKSIAQNVHHDHSLTALESDMQTPFTRTDQRGLDPFPFDDILAWQDFTDWLNADIESSW